jgi:hypothetical protein
MKFVSPIFDLYSDYLIVNQGQSSCTGLSALLDYELSHDKITRSLNFSDYGSKELWTVVKPFVRQISSQEGVICFDDTIEEKCYMDESSLICWHYDHCSKRNVKGINQITGLYYSQGVSLPICFKLIHKTEFVTDKKTKKLKRVSKVSKQQHFRQLIQQSVDNQLVFKYILADSWYSSAENFNFIHQIDRHFIIPLKSNRKVALSIEEKRKRNYQPIESLEIEDGQTLHVYVEGVDFPLVFTKQVFQNENDSEAAIYLVTNDLAADADCIQTYYALRWKIEEFHKSIKSNTGYAYSPASTIRTQSNHLFLSMLAFVKLEALKISQKKNHFALKKKLSMNALKKAWQELKILKANDPILTNVA